MRREALMAALLTSAKKRKMPVRLILKMKKSSSGCLVE